MATTQLNPQVKTFIEKIEDALLTQPDLDHARAKVVRQMEELNVLHPGMRSDIDEATEVLRNQLSAGPVAPTRSVYQERELWYAGPSEQARHWLALHGYLKNSKGRSEDILEPVDRISTEIVSMLGNPRKSEFNCRGLVLGYVQSGKTENMTAVIAKAVDSGYNMVIVLSGLTNKLRAQTQKRLRQDLTSRHEGSWQEHTGTGIDEDFDALKEGSFRLRDNVAHLLVMKKLATGHSPNGPTRGPLGRLLQYLTRMPLQERRRLKLLLIDDECDQASVNSSADPEAMSRANEAIRRLLNLMPASTYVGYTATPFANVLIDPIDDNGQPSDLYPKDFITSLPRPGAYFGPEKLFGHPPVDAAEPTTAEDGLDVINSISPSDIAGLNLDKGEDIEEFTPRIPASLKEAALYFLASCAARHARGQANEHMSMLVHTSVRSALHHKISEELQRFISNQVDALLNPKSSETAALRACWDKEIGRSMLNDPDAIPTSFDMLQPFLPDVFQRLTWIVENGTAEDEERLVFDDDSPACCIVTGGVILSRGLTIEGLCVSYFARNSTQYDTLLQMGRWFGYRVGYEDLQRIWTTDELMEKYTMLAGVELHLRRDIERYAELNVTPADLALRIQKVPGMAITGRTKLRNAEEVESEYFGMTLQTTTFRHLDHNAIKINSETGSVLVSKLQHGMGKPSADNPFLWFEVPIDPIIEFLHDYQAAGSEPGVGDGELVKFLERRRQGFATWNVAIANPRSSERSADFTLGTIEKVPMVRRSRLNPLDNQDPAKARIGVLYSKSDALVDQGGMAENGTPSVNTPTQRKKPLLLLYAIQSDSEAATGSDKRVNLEAASDLLGFVVITPGDKSLNRRMVAVQVNPEGVDDVAESED